MSAPTTHSATVRARPGETALLVAEGGFEKAAERTALLAFEVWRKKK